jgi:Probable zinc-ribbon domain
MQDQRLHPVLGPPVNEELLAPNNSYGAPDFVRRGYYVDQPFKCVDCGKEEIWTGSQQKWWYEVAKGFAYSTAIRCRLCRRKERARREAARRVHLEGIARKEQARAAKRTEKNK